ARRTRVVHASSGAPLEQTAMLEEDMHELPEHVVERLDQLLADVAVFARGLDLPFGAELREGDRQAAPLTRERDRAGGLEGLVCVGQERDRDVVLACDQLQLARQLAALSSQAERGQRA